MTDDDSNEQRDSDSSEDRQRKERVIHTRVSVVLERELKQLAGSLKVPVSNVVRAILEDAVGKIDEVGRFAEGEIRSVADRLEKHRVVLRTSAAKASASSAATDPDEEEAPPAEEQTASDAPSDEREQPQGAPDDEQPSTPAALDGVVGFQPLLLARPAPCAVCGQELSAGNEAFAGVRDDGGPKVIVHRDCLPFPKE